MHTHTYILRDIDPKLWQKVKVRATQDGVSIKAILVAALAAYIRSPRMAHATHATVAR